MKKYLGILLIMIGMILIPGNVNASTLVNFTECETVLNEELQKKITTCNYGYENTGDVDTESFILEMKLNPTNENTTVDLNLNAEYAVYAGDTEDDYTAIEIATIPAQTKAKIAEIVWTADATLDDTEVGGTVLTRISSLSSGTTQITEGSSSTSSDLSIGAITEAKVYNVEVIWGSLEYNFEKQADETYKWVPSVLDSNIVTINNYSNTRMNVGLVYETVITGVEASYEGKQVLYNGESNITNNSTILDPINEMPYDTNSYVTWEINLTGGTLEDVVEAVNNGNGKIGTITVVVADPDLQPGDIG